MKSRKLMSKRERFFRRVLMLIGTLIIIGIYHLKTKRVVGLMWIEVTLVLSVLLPLIRDIKLKNWRRDNT